MSTKTISLDDEEAYERLKSHKREGESFSDVVKRIAGERSWTEVAGILSEDEADELESLVEEGAVPFPRSARTPRCGRAERRMIEDTTFIIDVLHDDRDAIQYLDLIERENRPEKVSSITVLELYEAVPQLNAPEERRQAILDVLDVPRGRRRRRP